MSALDHRPYCYIDGCRNRATLIIESYPDTRFLCDDHKSIVGELLPWETVLALPDSGRAL